MEVSTVKTIGKPWRNMGKFSIDAGFSSKLCLMTPEFLTNFSGKVKKGIYAPAK